MIDGRGARVRQRNTIEKKEECKMEKRRRSKRNMKSTFKLLPYQRYYTTLAGGNLVRKEWQAIYVCFMWLHYF